MFNRPTDPMTNALLDIAERERTPLGMLNLASAVQQATATSCAETLKRAMSLSPVQQDLLAIDALCAQLNSGGTLPPSAREAVEKSKLPSEVAKGRLDTRSV